ncbi:flagellar biosynthetic protein FliO [Citrobacter amalonaticus]|uniref:Flagellar protein n=1 Tax=Citrobacter amalonaticus TaxID=35703 RepID=A0A2S4RPS6_CITAM|nr:flagellar biosynthetic protein FliO [Citrobacter amalonaticus]POT54778.1 flagellar biosynthetic protein FliO [Citrobacter amalonaticus]POT68950.1 flagellar biosynthetic protein FliO [Citrobacter amalonaticus]POU59088.1 flagellar biosynthetic protein FliO [Citrobacter amalonaticus]POV02322.1 flagellar biosynthetic protein FliO [Citrobacter amalonaticus]
MKSHTLTEIQTSIPNVDNSPPGSVLFNVGGALCLIILFIAGIAWIARRAGFAPHAIRGNKLLTVKSSQSLGQRERVVIVEVDDKWLLLGVTPSSINCLATLEKRDDEPQDAVASRTIDFQSVLSNMLKKRKTEPTE